MTTKQQKYLYGDYIENLHSRFLKRLDQIEAHHNFELGNEFEVAICQILRSFLPTKYGVCRGFVVSRDGETAGDDIIVYDQERFPTLRQLDKGDFSLLENIPIEAVYIYIEAKHRLNICRDQGKCTLTKAMEQVRNVKRKLMMREKVDLNNIDPYLNLPDITTSIDVSMPGYRNPPMTVILSRFIAVDGENTSDPEIIEKALISKPFNPDLLCPDLIIAGPDVYAAPGMRTGNTNRGQLIYEPSANSIYFSKIMRAVTYGIFLSRVGYAVDWIRLGRMPWAEILNDVQSN